MVVVAAIDGYAYIIARGAKAKSEKTSRSDRAPPMLWSSFLGRTNTPRHLTYLAGGSRFCGHVWSLSAV